MNQFDIYDNLTEAQKKRLCTMVGKKDVDNVTEVFGHGILKTICAGLIYNINLDIKHAGLTKNSTASAKLRVLRSFLAGRPDLGLDREVTGGNVAGRSKAIRGDAKSVAHNAVEDVKPTGDRPRREDEEKGNREG